VSGQKRISYRIKLAPMCLVHLFRNFFAGRFHSFVLLAQIPNTESITFDNAARKQQNNVINPHHAG